MSQLASAALAFTRHRASARSALATEQQTRNGMLVKAAQELMSVKVCISDSTLTSRHFSDVPKADILAAVRYD